MRKIIFLLLFWSPLLLYAQSISPERVARIKSATVRVTIEGSESAGSAFFISASGELLTCWHVVEPAFIRDSAGNMLGLHKIFIEQAGGDKTEVAIPLNFYQQLYLNARGMDYCLLTPLKQPGKKFGFFKPGDFNTVPEGQELYTCGYPTGMAQPFLSRGILSTKYTDSSTYFISNGIQQKIFRTAGLLDLTLNRGCSGGPVIKPGATVADDEVVGISDFILGPYGQATEEMYSVGNMQAEGTAATIVNIVKLVSTVVGKSANGISGCLPINHFLNGVRLMKK